MSTGLELAITFFLLAGNAFFVGAEFAVITARRDKLQILADQGKTRAKAAIKAGQDLPLLIAGVQLGVTVCSLLLGALAEPAFAHLIEAPMHAVGLPEIAVQVVGFAMALVVVTMLHTVLGEMVPKNLALAGPERAAMLMVPIHYAFCRVIRPILVGLSWCANRVLRRLGVEPKGELDNIYTAGDIANLLAESRKEGLLEEDEHRRLSKTLATAKLTVAQVYIPLDKLTCLPATPTVRQVEEAVVATGYSRFPIRAAQGNFLGYLHVKDVLDLTSDALVPATRIRPLPIISIAARADEAISALRRARSHVAMVVDDSVIVGLVALEDVVEEYVGTVQDGTHVQEESLV
jgi:CBS domain containing-hemolysin-like protein